MTSVRLVDTPVGPARLHADRAHRPIAALVLCHGAGRGVDTPDLAALAAELPRRSISVFRIEQPWVLAGKRMAPRPAVLDAATVASLDAVRVRSPLVLGGRSAGARSACRLARRMGAVGCLALAFPLHPPGRPEASRVAELRAVGLPTYVVQGERDAFGTAAEFPPSTRLAVIPRADHSFAVPARASIDAARALQLVVDAASEWIASLVSPWRHRNSRAGVGRS